MRDKEKGFVEIFYLYSTVHVICQGVTMDNILYAKQVFDELETQCVRVSFLYSGDKIIMRQI